MFDEAIVAVERWTVVLTKPYFGLTIRAVFGDRVVHAGEVGHKCAATLCQNILPLTSQLHVNTYECVCSGCRSTSFQHAPYLKVVGCCGWTVLP